MSCCRFIALSLLSVGPALFGCDTAHPRATDGALAISVQPSSGSPQALPPRGSFSLRRIDQAQRARVVLAGDAYQTLHVPLPAGSYVLAWEPAGESAALSADARAIEADAVLPRIVVVAPGQLTLVDVSTPLDLGARVATLASQAFPARRGLSK